MRKNPRSRILRGQPKEQHISTIPTSCHIYIYIYSGKPEKAYWY